MKRKFNTTGVCIPNLHYMVDISNKLKKIKKMVYSGDYFVINRPRQYGKTTTMYMLEQELKDEYLVLSISFEGVGDKIFGNESEFTLSFLKLLAKSAKFHEIEISKFIMELSKGINNFEGLSEAITELIEYSKKNIILFIDEVDKSSNNQLFLSFLGILRNKFLLRQQDKDKTFHSVILAGVYDIKNLKLKLRQDDEKKYNSPWNIAVRFNVDMKFNTEEITTMLKEYSSEKNISMNVKEIAENIHFYTNGYPFLVSKLCQIIDEDLMLENENSWNLEYINKAVKEILQENNTLFDDLIKNVENNRELSEYVSDLIINGNEKTFNIDNPIINLGVVFGYLENNNGRVKISNRIFQERLYNYFSSKLENKTDMSAYNFKEKFIIKDGLDFETIILRFQQFVKEQYSSRDEEERKYLFTYVHRCKFHNPKASFGMSLKREGRLLFLAFLKPIINGVGFDFKEVQISEEKRLDIVVTYLSNKYVVELKIWRGNEYHKKGLNQLKDYLDIQGLDIGYLVIFNFNKDKEYKEESIEFEGKKIFLVYL